MSRANVEAVRRSVEAWNRGDVDAWLEGAHPEIEWSSEVLRRMEGDDTPIRGVAAMRRYWDDWRTLWSVTVDLAEIRDLGDTVVAIGSFRTHGETSEVDLEQPIAYVFEFEGGLARRVRAYFDLEQALRAAHHGESSPNM